MLRLIALVLLAVAALPALETPLIITNATGNTSVIINPALGTMTFYAVEDGALNQRSSANFLTDLEYIDRMIVDHNGEEAFSALRLGVGANGAVTKLAYAEFFAYLDKLGQTKAEKEAGVDSLFKRARRSELEYWAKDHPYDGVVRAALGQRYLMVAVPSKRALLVYQVDSERLELVSWRYYGTELYVPHVFFSAPTPEDILRQLPSDIKEERKLAIEAQMKALTESKSQTIELKPSDLWVVAGGNSDRFAVLDIANNHLMAYEFTGKLLELRSIRNIEVDLMIPSAYRSEPDLNAIFQRWQRDKVRKEWLKQMGMENDVEAFRVYVESRQSAGASGKASPVQANVLVATGEIVIDFTDKRKAAVYRFAAGAPTMDLMSMRDYTVDVGVSLLDGEIRQRMLAAQLYAMAEKMKGPVQSYLTLRTALQMNPLQVRDFEKSKRFVDKVKDQPGYAEMIEKAAKDAAAMEEEIKRRQEEAQKRREDKNRPKTN